MKLGIDIGGTTVKGGLLNGTEFVREYEVPTRGREGREAILSSLFAVADELFTEEVGLIGVSSAGNIDPYRGICVYATENLMGWTGVNLRDLLEARYRVPCKVENDAICALKGELLFCPECKNATMLTFGTGVGGASLIDGEIVRGENFDGARWGHVVLVEGGRRCSCGGLGCAEAYLSATALLARGREKMPDLQSCKQLFERYAAGNVHAYAVLREFGGYLNQLLNIVRAQARPERVILGGGMAQSEEIILSLIENKSDVVFARLKNRAGVVGACL